MEMEKIMDEGRERERERERVGEILREILRDSYLHARWTPIEIFVAG